MGAGGGEFKQWPLDQLVLGIGEQGAEEGE